MNNKNIGFTLIECVIALAITAIIGLGAMISAAQIYTVTRQNNDKATAIQQAQNVGYWLSHDCLMANNVSGGSLINPSDSLNFTWSDWETGFTYVIQYSLITSNSNYDVKRLATKQTPTGNITKESVVANHIVKVEKVTGPLRFTVYSLSGLETVSREYTAASRLEAN